MFQFVSTHRLIERSVLLMAKEAGYDLPEDTAITHGASLFPEAEPEAAPVPDPANPDAPPVKRRRRRRIQERDEGYDANDPFVDDSEIATTEPKFYHAPEKDGFYVAQGPLILKQTRKGRGRKLGSKNKPKVGADGANGIAPTVNGGPPLPDIPRPPLPPHGTPSGTRMQPITLDDEDGHLAGPSFGGADVTTLSNTMADVGMTDKEAEREARRQQVAKLLRLPIPRDKNDPLSPQLTQAIEDLEKEVKAGKHCCRSLRVRMADESEQPTSRRRSSRNTSSRSPSTSPSSRSTRKNTTSTASSPSWPRSSPTTPSPSRSSSRRRSCRSAGSTTTLASRTGFGSWRC